MTIERFNGEYQFLSNFYPAPVRHGEMVFPSVEHAYQAAKMVSITDAMRIRDCFTPSEAKRMGNRFTIRHDWEDIKLDTMLELVRKKFTHHKELKEKLFATGTQQLIEGNYWHDTFWGVCNGKGENHLGKILMRVREELK